MERLKAPSAKVRIDSAVALKARDGPLERALKVLFEVAVKPTANQPRRAGKRVTAESDSTSAIRKLCVFGERSEICVPRSLNVSNPTVHDLAHYQHVQQILLETARDPTAKKLTRELASDIVRFTKAVRN